jgi:Ran GTPase-activating protein (RanGAP) involved in mRNA processing and transport
MVYVSGARAIGEALRLNTSLTKVDLSYNNIEDDGCSFIAEGIKASGMLVELALSGNLIGDNGATSVAKLLLRNGTLTKLELARNSIGDKGAAAIGEAIKQRNQEIHVRFRLVYSIRLPFLLIPRNTQQALRIGMKYLGQPDPIEETSGRDGRRRLSSSLPLSALQIYAKEKHDYRSGCLPLLHLDLSYNQLGQAGGEAMALALKHNPKMKVMDLTGNRVQNTGLAAIAAALPTNRKLRQLSLSSNNITSKGTGALGSALQRNFSLKRLTLSDNGIDDQGASHLGPAVRNSHSLKSIDLSYNRICRKGDTSLARASGTGNLAKMMARPHIDLSSNWSTSFGV